ncbi:hypothetical protein PAMA_015360 [Pampus argenteus]
MDILPLLCVVSVALTGLTKGDGVLPDGPLTAPVGGTVMFTTTVTPPETPFLVVSWSFTFNNTESIPIITSTLSDSINPEYESRITLNRSTGSLELRDLALTDSGEYSVSITPNGGFEMRGSTRLEILVPVSNVKVDMSSTDLVEFNSSVSLSCSSSGSSVSFLWLNGSSEVTAGERVHLTDGGSTLTINNVTRFDQGPFRCKVSNAVSEGTSDPVNLSISFGPENIILELSSSHEYFEEGSTISMSCSAVSRPSALFQWFLDGSLLSDTGPKLTLENVQMNQSGNYSCQAFNTKTLRYQTSQPSAVTVVVPVSNVKVDMSSTDLVEFNSSVRLSCSSSGSSVSFLWLNGSSEVTAGERVHLTDGGSTLTINNVTRYDQAPFTCHVTNVLSNITSDPVEMSISFGPHDISIKVSKTSFKKGSTISMSCSAVSRPSALFQWFLNGSLLSDTGPKLTLENVQMNQSGNYSCQAFNTKTLRYQTSQPSAIIVVGGEGQENTAHSEELNYVGVHFAQNKPGGTVQLGLQNNTTEYAQIQVNKGGAAVSAPPAYDVHMQKTRRPAPQPGTNGAHAQSDMRDITMIPHWKTLYTVLLVTLNVVPVLGFGVQVSWVKPVTAGFSTTFTCSSSCFPNCTYTWSFKGHTVKGSTLTWTPHGLDSTMELQCTVLNAETGVSRSVTSTVEIKNQVSVQISPARTVPSLNQSLDLVCHGATPGDLPGTSYLEDQVVWYKDGQKVTVSEKMHLLQNNLTLHFDSLLRSDAGFYQCETYLPAFKQSKVFSLGYLLNFDPWNVSISGPDTVFPGRLSKFTCLTSCTLNVDCTVKWQFRGGFPVGLYFSVHQNELSWTPSIPGTFQNFTCIAENPAAGRSAEATKMVEVKVPISNVTLKANATNLVEFNDTAVLTCSVSNGTSLSYTWLKGSSVVTASDGVEFSDGSATLTIPRVTRYDEGPFRCNVSNGISHEISLPVHLNISYGPSNATVMVMPMKHTHRTGSNIILSCTAESNPPATIEWMFGGVSLNQFGPQIHLQSVTESDSGDYECLFYNRVTSRFSSATAMIRIMDGPMTPVIMGPSMALTETLVTLNCSSASHPPSRFSWYFNDSLVATTSEYQIGPLSLNMSGKYICMAYNHITDQNSFAYKMLTVYVERNDTGDYQCMAISPIENMTSPAHMLLVNFGPETPVIYGPSFATTGHYAVFNCSAMSVPTSNFSWWFNGSLMANTSVFTTSILSLNMSGEYTCVAYNYVTGKNSTNSMMLTVIDAIESVMVKSNTVPIASENFTLTCEVTGYYTSIEWRMNSMNSSTDSKLMSYDENKLHFTPVTLYNDGAYWCIATNQDSLHESPKYNLLVNYGPMSISISGPGSAKVGLTVSLKCTSNSRPDCDFYWYLNNQPSAVNTGSVITFLASKEREGNYTCKARNPVTNITMYYTKALTVTDHASALHFSSQYGLKLTVLFAVFLSVLFH